MHSTLTLQQTDPHDAFAIEPGVAGAARASQASPDPVHEVLSLLSRRRAQMASGVSAVAPTPTVDTTFRAVAVDDIRIPGDRPAMGGWKKASIAFLFALCSALAASAWKHHGDAARAMVSSWMPPSAFTSFAPAETPPPAPVQAAAAEQAPAQPPPAVATAADSAQLLPSMAHDLAAMGQQIEQLKASIEQLRDSQAQMSRDIAKNSETKAADTKASEPNLRPRIATLPPRPVAVPPRKPRPAFPPAPAAATSPSPPYPPLPPPALSQPAPPPQTAAEPDGEPVVRPPMPLH
jgi:hypothetical protein